MRVTSVESTELFVGTTEQPRQIVAVELSHSPGRTVRLTVEGSGVAGEALVTVADDGTARAEIPVRTGLAPGERRDISVTATDVIATDEAQVAVHPAEFTAAEPGWTMFMVSHFHYDPVWWNTQGAYTETWDVADDPASTGLPARTFDSAASPA